MLTYATLADYKRMKNISLSDTTQDNWIKDNLQRATRYIDRYCRRAFFPEVEERKFAIPNRYIDLSRRRFTSANLFLDKDLLETISVVNGNGTELTDPEDYFLIEHNIYPKFGISLIFPNFWKVGNNLTSFNYDYPEIKVTGYWGYHETWPNDAWLSTYTSIPTGGIDDSQTDIEVPDLDVLDENGNLAFTPGALIKVEDEYMVINEVYELNIALVTHYYLLVARGQRGTTAVSHNEGIPIKKFRVHEDITQVCLQIAKLWREYGEAAGGRLGVSDVSAGVEIAIPADPLNVLKSYVRKMSGPMI